MTDQYLSISLTIGESLYINDSTQNSSISRHNIDTTQIKDKGDNLKKILSYNN